MSNVNLQNPLFPLPTQTTTQADGSQQVPAAVPGEVDSTNPLRTGEAPGVLQPRATAAQTGAAQGPLPLPDVAGTSPTGDARNAAGNSTLAWLQLKPFRLAQLLTQLTDQKSDDAIFRGEVHRSAAKNQYALQRTQAELTTAEVQGERKKAFNELVGSITAATVTAGLAFAGTSLNLNRNPFSALSEIKTKTTLAQTSGAALSASGNAFGQLINSTTTYFDKMHGGGKEADEAKMAKAWVDMLLQIYKSRDDEFQQGEQQAHQSLQQILELRKDTYAANAQTQQNIIQKIN